MVSNGKFSGKVVIGIVAECEVVVIKRAGAGSMSVLYVHRAYEEDHWDQLRPIQALVISLQSRY